MDDGYGGAIVQIIHPFRNLHRPADQHVRRHFVPVRQYLVQRTAAGVLHHKAEVALHANAQQCDDVFVRQCPAQFRLFQHILADFGVVAALALRLDGHLLAAPVAAPHLVEAALADHLLHHQVLVVDLDGLHVADALAQIVHLQHVAIGHKIAREYADFVANLARPPAHVAADRAVLGQHDDHSAADQRQLVLVLCRIVVQRRPHVVRQFVRLVAGVGCAHRRLAGRRCVRYARLGGPVLGP